ncbi:MAG: DUF86 domain-containing protein [Cyclobacteriaceae bacterium]|nr:DUF86 domain-containing protein [Cyclobacteriaceae bacterium]
MNNDIRKYLRDILTAIDSIDIHLDRKRDFNLFLKNFTSRRAIERELEIIGEATNRILKIEPEIKISEGRLIVDLRNKVIHSYDTVDEMILWKIINRDLPVLKEEITALLQQ